MAVAADEKFGVPLRSNSAEDWAEPYLGPNLPVLSDEQIRIAGVLMEERQGHLFSGWPGLGVSDWDKLKVEKLNAHYPGGLVSYIRNARKLLSDSKGAKNPMRVMFHPYQQGNELSLEMTSLFGLKKQV